MPDPTWTLETPEAPWGARAMPRGGVLDDHFFVIGGRKGAVKIYGDTWRSPDGVEWEKMSDGTGWGNRCYPEVEIVDGTLVLTAGQGLSTFHNDVWASSDHGRSWEQVCGDAPWGVRAGHHTTTVDGAIYLFGGARNSWNRIFYPELWASRDLGESWELVARLPDDMGRAGMQVVEVGDDLYFMGGDHDRPVFSAKWEGRRNDVWRSADRGETWELIGHAPWSARTGHQAIAHDGRVVVIGGHEKGEHRYRQALAHDLWVWDPADGMDGWAKVSDNVWGCADHPERDGKSDFMLEIKDGRLWTLGGDREVASPWPQDNDVWSMDLSDLE